MKASLVLKKILFTLFAVFSILLVNAQEEKSKIHIKIEKDGKVIKDTVYAVNKDTDPEIVSKIIDMSLKENGVHHKVMALKSKDGKLQEVHGDHDMMLKEMERDNDDVNVFVTTEEGENGETKVIVKKIYGDKDGEKEFHGDHEMMHKEMDRDNVDVNVTTEEGENGETKVIVKKVYLDKNGEKELEDAEENVYIFNSNDGNNKEVYEIKTRGEKPQWIEKDGDKILIIDTKDGKSKNIKVIKEGKDSYSYETDEGETIIINSSKADKEKEINVEVVIEEKKMDVKKEEKKIKKRKKENK